MALRLHWFSSWSHEQGVPSKVTAELMGHAKVDMTLNTYTQVMPDALEEAVGRMSEELFTRRRGRGR